MMVKARAGQGGPALARYLMDGKNEHAELVELRNMDAPSFKAALFDMDMLARGSQCHTHALHVQMRAAPGERLFQSPVLITVELYFFLYTSSKSCNASSSSDSCCHRDNSWRCHKSKGSNDSTGSC